MQELVGEIYTLVMRNSVLSIAMLMVSSRWGSFFDVVDSGLRVKLTELWIKNSKPPPGPNTWALGLHYGHRHDIIPFMITFFLEEMHSFSFNQNAVTVVHLIVQKSILHITYINQAHYKIIFITSLKRIKRNSKKTQRYISTI